jgi:hypothetical protein
MARLCRRMIVLILAAVLVAACGGNEASRPAPTTAPAKPTEAPKPAAPAATEAPKPAAPAASPAAPAAPPAAPTSPPPTAAPPAAPPTGTSPDRRDSMRIRLRVEDTIITATLIDSETTRDFVSLLPLSLTLEDYAGTEKISNLPRRLSTEGAPSGSDPSVGDVAYYAPWGNLAVFYRDFGYSNGLVILGRLDSGIEALSVPGSVRATVELAR